MRDPFLSPPTFLVSLTRPLASYLSLSTLPLHIHEVLFGWASYHLLFTTISPFLSSRLVPGIYNKLNARQKVNWNVRVVSLIQASFINAAALYVIFNDAQRNEMDWRGRIWGYSGATGMVQGFAAGYFLWDVSVSILYLRILGLGSLAHAISPLVVTCLGFVSIQLIQCFLFEGSLIDLAELKRPFANYYGLNFVLYELSTPSLNLHWFFDKLGMTGSRIQLCNGIALLVTFFACRIVWGNYQSLRIFWDILTALQTSSIDIPLAKNATMFDYGNPDIKVNLSETSVTMTLPIWLVFIYLGSNSILNFLNIYWFGKLIETVKSRFQPKDQVEKKKKKK